MSMEFGKYVPPSETSGAPKIIEKPSEKDIKDRLNTVYEGASINMWLSALKKIQEEIGPDNFKDMVQNLFVWAAKENKDERFFTALANMHAGSSLEMNINTQKREQVAFGYFQSRIDRMFFQTEASRLEGQIREIDEQRKTDHDIRLDAFLDEASGGLKRIQEKQRQSDELIDTLETVMRDNDMDPDGDPRDWAKKFE